MVTRTRPKKQFELLEIIKKEISEDKDLCRTDYNVRLGLIMDIYYYLNKELNTRLAIYDLKLNFHNVLGEIIFNDDMASLLNDNAFDALILSNNRNAICKIKFADKTIKAQFKMLQPMALNKCVSLSYNQVEKYIKQGCDLILVFPNSVDPNYYNPQVRNLMYFPRGLSANGYQYYLLPHENLKKGEKGYKGNYIYEVKHNGIMYNIGLRYKLGQLNLKEFDNDKSL